VQVRVLYFGVLKDVMGGEREEFAVPEGCTVAGLLEMIAGRAASEPGLWGSLAVAVNREYARGSVELHEGDEVALLPPVSGGVDAG
jgi:molybdopterin converting factor subunit 1